MTVDVTHMQGSSARGSMQPRPTPRPTRNPIQRPTALVSHRTVPSGLEHGGQGTSRLKDRQWGGHATARSLQLRGQRVMPSPPKAKLDVLQPWVRQKVTIL